MRNPDAILCWERETTGVCIRCHAIYYIRPKGLCNRCYRELPECRGRYEPRSSNGRRGSGLGKSDRDTTETCALPARPVEVEPGSQEKIALLADRARQRIALFHPAEKRITRQA